MSDEPQNSLFAEADLQKVEARPEPVQSIYVHFEKVEDIEAFAKLIGFPVSMKTRAITYPVDDLFPDQSMSALRAMRPEPEAEDGS